MSLHFPDQGTILYYLDHTHSMTKDDAYLKKQKVLEMIATIFNKEIVTSKKMKSKVKLLLKTCETLPKSIRLYSFKSTVFQLSEALNDCAKTFSKL